MNRCPGFSRHRLLTTIGVLFAAWQIAGALTLLLIRLFQSDPARLPEVLYALEILLGTLGFISFVTLALVMIGVGQILLHQARRGAIEQVVRSLDQAPSTER